MSSKRKRSLTADEKYERSLRARRRFRALVRLIIHNKTWLTDVEDEQLGDDVKKNIKLLTRKKGVKSLLTLKEKAMLNKPVGLRTEEEKTHLAKLLSNLKCFRRFPCNVKSQLASVMHFIYFPPNRVVLKQNYEPVNMYVVLTGQLVVSITTWNNSLKEYITKDVNMIEAGSMFGEVSLLTGLPRTATVTTHKPCELLYVGKDDFMVLLKDTVAGQWKETKTNMSWFTYFDDWREDAIREACMLCQREYFVTDDVCLSETVGHHEYVYFIIQGHCYIVEKLLVEDPGRGGKTKKEAHYFKICTLNRQACFNIGENLKNRLIIAGGKTECLLFPRYLIYQKENNKTGVWDQVREFLNNHVPDTQQMYKRYYEERRWTRYKQNLVKQIISQRKRSTQNCINNVPLSIRLKEGCDMPY